MPHLDHVSKDCYCDHHQRRVGEATESTTGDLDLKLNG